MPYAKVNDISMYYEEHGKGQPLILLHGAIVGLHMGMTHPDLVLTLLCVGVNYHNDDLVKEANKFFDDVKEIERKHPKLAAEYAAFHARNKHPDYWKILINQLAVNLAKNPNYTIKDLQKIPVPTLLIAGENDLWANRQQMLDMRQHIPISEMLIVNNAEHEVQHTHAHIVGPVIMDFLERHKDPKQATRL